MDNQDPGAPRKQSSVGCVTFLVILALVVGGVYLTRESWLPAFNSMIGRTAKPAPEIVADKNSVTVFVEVEGYTYHRANCDIPKHEVRAITLHQALTSGYKSCPKCNPPQ